MLWFSTSLISRSRGELLFGWLRDKTRRRRRKKKRWCIFVRGSHGPPNLCTFKQIPHLSVSVLRLSIALSLAHLLLLCLGCLHSVLSHSIALSLSFCLIYQASPLHLIVALTESKKKKKKKRNQARCDAAALETATAVQAHGFRCSFLW